MRLNTILPVLFLLKLYLNVFLDLFSNLFLD